MPDLSRGVLPARFLARFVLRASRLHGGGGARGSRPHATKEIGVPYLFFVSRLLFTDKLLVSLRAIRLLCYSCVRTLDAEMLISTVVDQPRAHRSGMRYLDREGLNTNENCTEIEPRYMGTFSAHVACTNGLASGLFQPVKAAV